MIMTIISSITQDGTLGIIGIIILFGSMMMIGLSLAGLGLLFEEIKFLFFTTVFSLIIFILLSIFVSPRWIIAIILIVFALAVYGMVINK